MTIRHHSLSSLGRRVLLLTVLVSAGVLGVRDAAAQSAKGTAKGTAKGQVPDPSAILNPLMGGAAVPGVPGIPDGLIPGSAGTGDPVTDYLNQLKATRNRAPAPAPKAAPTATTAKPVTPPPAAKTTPAAAPRARTTTAQQPAPAAAKSSATSAKTST